MNFTSDFRFPSSNFLAAIILAAGDGRRFGKPKYQGEYQGKTFLEIIRDKLRQAGFSDIICVKQKFFIMNNKELLYVDNPTPELGMISSLYCALKSYPNYKSYLIIPVDHPFVELSTIETIKNAFDADKDQVIRPTFNGLPGHPIIIPNILSYLKTSDYPGGLRQLIKDSKLKTFDIAVSDRNILKNINFESDCLK